MVQDQPITIMVVNEQDYIWFNYLEFGGISFTPL